MIIFYIGTGSQFLSNNIHINDRDIIYCFEPVPELANKLKNAYGESNNFHIIQKAVSESNDIAKFNVAGISDHNLSSLLNFSTNAFNNWPGRSDFIVTQNIKVETTRLDTFIETLQIPIKKIDYLNVDTNGCDLIVLNSMGHYLKIISKGSMIASMTPESIYVKQNSVTESIEFLRSNNFLITNIEPIDQYGNQSRIYFERHEIHST